jgi:hypothetical protein
MLQILQRVVAAKRHRAYIDVALSVAAMLIV